MNNEGGGDMLKKIFFVSLFLLSFYGCNTSHEVKMAPVEVKPIHITIDVRVKIEKDLDDFFGELDQEEEKLIKE